MMDSMIERKWCESIAYLTNLLVSLDSEGEEFSYFKKLCANKWKLLIICVILDIEENLNSVIIDSDKVRLIIIILLR